MSLVHHHSAPDGKWVVDVPIRGAAILQNSLLNRGTSFSEEERRTLKIEGLLPPRPTTIDIQERRSLENIERKPTPLEKYIGLASLQDRNEVLFYRLLANHAEELMPIVYTPTVGEACQLYSRIFRRSRGVWITPDMRGRITEVLRNAARDTMRLIVVTDNERILGLGDQGAGGIGIPIGKLALYVVGAGIHPSRTLPVSLDVGTDNEELLADPLYLGWKNKRLRGPEYDSLVEEFVQAVQECFPKALLQWEDFKKQNAFDLLGRYRERLLSFNDDIEGTAAVALAGVLAAGRATGTPLHEQRLVIAGAGAAGIGIGRLVRAAMSRAGLKGEDLGTAVAVLDSRGLMVEGGRNLDTYKKEFSWKAEWLQRFGLQEGDDLQTVVTKIKPTVLLGTTGTPDTFDRKLIETMAEHVDQPVVLPFSNPTSKSEARPADILAWSKGRALVATGSPFEPVESNGRRIRIGQGNNVYIFPGIGCGALASQARFITDSMFAVAAEVLAAAVSEQDLAEGALYPRIQELRRISERIGIAVAHEAIATGASSMSPDTDFDSIVPLKMWTPEYPRLNLI